MIELVTPIPSGAAVSISLNPPETDWVLLRRSDSDFIGYPDESAVIVASGDGGEDEVQITDFEGLLNDIPYWYQEYQLVDGVWVAPYDAYEITPTYESQPGFMPVDPVELVRNRLESALVAEVTQGNLNPAKGMIQVLRSPPILDNVQFPCVTVLLDSRVAEVRGVGEFVTPSFFNEADDVWDTFEGWLDRTVIQITVWSLNADERADIRHAVERILLMNLPVFDAAGLSLIDVSQTDNFDPQTYGVPVYQAVFQFSCMHPAIVRDRVPSIHSIESYPNGEKPIQ